MVVILNKLHIAELLMHFLCFHLMGKKLAFASNRQADGKPTRATNVFVADWIDNPEKVDLEFQTKVKN